MINEKLIYQEQAEEILRELAIKDLLPRLEKMLADDLEEEAFFEDTIEAFIKRFQDLRKQLKDYSKSDVSISFNTFLITNK
jgi:hypothetical protein